MSTNFQATTLLWTFTTSPQEIAGSLGGGRSRFHKLELRHSDHKWWASLWAVYDVEGGEFYEWLNARIVRTTGELLGYLTNLATDEYNSGTDDEVKYGINCRRQPLSPNNIVFAMVSRNGLLRSELIFRRIFRSGH